MKAIWNSFPEDQKPEWLSMEQIEAYGESMGVSERVRALLIPVQDAPHKIFISTSNDLRELQQHVGGRIEPLDVLGDGISLYTNEDTIGAPPNRALYATKEMEDAGYLSQMDYPHAVKEGELYTILFGDIVAVAYDDDMKLKDLTHEQVHRLSEQFKDTDSGFIEALKIMHQKSEPDREGTDGISLSSECRDACAAKEALSHDGCDPQARDADVR